MEPRSSAWGPQRRRRGPSYPQLQSLIQSKPTHCVQATKLIADNSSQRLVKYRSPLFSNESAHLSQEVKARADRPCMSRGSITFIEILYIFRMYIHSRFHSIPLFLRGKVGNLRLSRLHVRLRFPPHTDAEYEYTLPYQVAVMVSHPIPSHPV